MDEIEIVQVGCKTELENSSDEEVDYLLEERDEEMTVKQENCDGDPYKTTHNGVCPVGSLSNRTILPKVSPTGQTWAPPLGQPTLQNRKGQCLKYWA